MDNVSVYTNKDGRTRVYLKDSKKVISYPRYLMEKEIGRPLESYEQIHHLDGNPLNNDISNLEIKHISAHLRDHATKYVDKYVVCHWCGKEFLWTAKQQRNHHGNLSRNRSDLIFCSKSCCGSYGKTFQMK